MTPAVVRKNAHGGPQVRRNTRPSLRSGFTAYAALSPETNSSGLRRRRIGDRSKARSGSTISISLTPATGARTTRFCRPQLPRAIRLDRPACCRKKFRLKRLSAVRLARHVRSRKEPPCKHTSRPMLPSVSPQPVPTFVTMANAPLPRDRIAAVCRFDLGGALSEKFLRSAKYVSCHEGQISDRGRAVIVRSARLQLRSSFLSCPVTSYYERARRKFAVSRSCGCRRTRWRRCAPSAR